MPDGALDHRPSTDRIALLVGTTLPTLVVLIAGLAHPPHLTADSAAQWRDLHIVLLPVFPLMGLGPYLLARRAGRWWGRVAALGGFLFAVFYTSLDVLAGIAAGTVVLADEGDARSSLFRIANQLAPIGVVGLAAGYVVAGVAIARTRVVAAPGGILASVGAALILPGHIWFPTGTLALALVIAGALVLAMLAPDPPHPDPAGPRVPSGPAPTRR